MQTDGRGPDGGPGAPACLIARDRSRNPAGAGPSFDTPQVSGKTPSPDLHRARAYIPGKTSERYRRFMQPEPRVVRMPGGVRTEIHLQVRTLIGRFACSSISGPWAGHYPPTCTAALRKQST